MGQVVRLSDYISSKELKADLVDLNKTIDNTAKTLLNLIEVTKKNTETNTKGNATHSEANKAIKDVNEAQKQLTKSEVEVEKIKKQSLDVQAKLIAGQTSEAKTLEQLKQKKAEQNKQIHDTIKLQKTEKGSIDQLVLANKKLLADRNKITTATQKGRAQIAAINKEMDKNTAKIKQNSNAVEKQKDNIGNYKSALGGIKGVLGAFGLALGGAAIAVKAFNGIMGATQTLADGFKRVMDQAKAGVDFFFRTIASGDWKDFGKRFKEVMVAAGKYADTMDELGDLNRSLSVAEGKHAAKLANLQVIYSNVANTEKDRLAATEEYIKIKKELADKTVKYAKDEYDAIVKNTAIQIGTSEELIKSLSEEYDTQVNVLKIGKQYNTLIKERAKLEYLLASQIDPLAGRVISKKDAIIMENKLQDINNQIIALGDNGKIAGEIQIKYQSTNDDLLNKVAESAKKYYSAQAAFDEETRRAQTMRGTIINQIRAKEKTGNKEKLSEDKAVLKSSQELNNTIEGLSNIKEATEQKQIEAHLKLIEDSAQREINVQTDKLTKGLLTEEQYAREILQLQLDTIEKQLEISDLSYDQKLDIETKLAEAKKALYDYDKEAYENAEEKKTAKTQEEIDKRLEAAQKAIQIINNIGQMGFETANTLIETESQNLEEAYQYQLSLAGDNEKAKEKIDKDFDKKRKELMRKQAIADKLSAIFSATINTAQGITASIALGPWGIILAVLIGILGAVQIASIASRPIPSFAKGVKEIGEGTIGEYGEAGRELIMKPGETPYIAEKATIDYIPKGTTIIPNYETEKILAGHGGITERKLTELINEVKKGNNRPVNETRLTENGLEYNTIRGNNKMKWQNKYMHRG